MESSTITPAAGRAVDAPTLNEALRRTAANHPDIVAVRTADDSVSLTWPQLLARVDALAGGLAKLGVKRGETVAIMLGNRPEFHVADLAAVTFGATPFSIYTTYPAEEIEYLVTDSGARLAIVEQAFLPVCWRRAKNLPQLEHVIVVDGEAPEGTLALAEVEGSDPDFDPASADAAQPDDILTLIYTSGTTGPPKGVQLSHHNVMFAAQTTRRSSLRSGKPRDLVAARGPYRRADGPPLPPDDLRRVGHHLSEPPRDSELSPQVHPTWFFAVPRIWEKLKAGLRRCWPASPRSSASPWRRQSPPRWSVSGCASQVSRSPTTSRLASRKPIRSTSPGSARCSAWTRYPG